MADNTTVNISMPQTMRDFVDERMKALGCGNVSEYFRHLVRLDHERKVDERIAEMAIASLEKRQNTEWTPSNRAKFRETAKAALAAQLRNKAKAG